MDTRPRKHPVVEDDSDWDCWTGEMEAERVRVTDGRTWMQSPSRVLVERSVRDRKKSPYTPALVRLSPTTRRARCHGVEGTVVLQCYSVTGCITVLWTVLQFQC